MTSETVWVALASLLVAALLTAVARKLGLSRGLLDVPNKRSSHKVPVPRGGGSAIVLTSVGAWVVLTLAHSLRLDTFMALSGGGMAVAIVGLLDDHFRLSARVRFAVHVAAALWALVWLGGLPPLRIGYNVISFGWVGYVLGLVGIVWATNLFNFMDGIDGIASSEAVFVAWCGTLIAFSAGVDGGGAASVLALGAACLGFLLWNWPPAKIFMGDVGSGYLGYVIAVLAIAAARENSAALFVWLTLGGVFFVDATVTLVRRLLRGERVYEAHRSHAYQWLSRRWNSHLRVTLLVLCINVLWLLPMAWLCVIFPENAWWISMVSLAPLAILAFVAGAGRAE